VGKLTVRLKQRPEQPKTEPHFLPRGLSIQVPAFQIDRTDVTLQGGQQVAVQQARGTLEITRWRIDLDPLELRDPAGQVTGKLTLRATEPLGCARDLADSGSCRMTTFLPVQGRNTRQSWSPWCQPGWMHLRS
jgi:hypothetical protein